MLTASSIFFELKSSTLVSDLYGLMRRMLCLISVTPYCKITVPFVKRYVFAKGPLYSVLYVYALWSVRMTLSLTL